MNTPLEGEQSYESWPSSVVGRHHFSSSVVFQ